MTASPSRDALREELLGILEQKHHWAWPAFAQGRISLAQALPHFQQEWEVYVRDFPVLLAGVLGQGPPARVREALAANIYEEQTGGLSSTGPHPQLFLRMMDGCGFDRSAFESVRLLPAAGAYRQFLERCSHQGPWVLGAAVLTLFVEGSVHERKELEALKEQSAPSAKEIDEAIQAHPLVRFHGVKPAAMELMRAHKQVEGGHRLDAWEMVLDNVTPTLEQTVVEAMKKSLALWHAYRDDVARACGVTRELVLSTGEEGT